jgi:hypothetical protein
VSVLVVALFAFPDELEAALVVWELSTLEVFTFFDTFVSVAGFVEDA